VQKQEQEHRARDGISTVLVDADYMADYRLVLKQNLVNDGVQRMDFALNRSEPHATLLKPNIY